FPYTTLFRSDDLLHGLADAHGEDGSHAEQEGEAVRGRGTDEEHEHAGGEAQQAPPDGHAAVPAVLGRIAAEENSEYGADNAARRGNEAGERAAHAAGLHEIGGDVLSGSGSHAEAEARDKYGEVIAVFEHAHGEYGVIGPLFRSD